MREADKIQNTFNRIARRYDIANHVLSLGHDFYWRKKFAALISPPNGSKILDICCGSGDVAIQLANLNADIEITACDFSGEMLKIAQSKAAQKKLNIKFSQADFTNLKFFDNCFDIITCAFGIRNVPDYPIALKQAHRTVKTGGNLAILEFSMPKNRIFRVFYYFYLHYILPLIGGIITGRYNDYRYLANSVDKWDKHVNLVEELENAGFNEIVVKNLSFGIVKAYICKKSG